MEHWNDGDARQLTLLKRGHYYLFRYFPGDESRMVDTLVEKAADPKCGIDYFDAAILAHQMGQPYAKMFEARLISLL